MLAAWHPDLESLEAISQDDLARCLFPRMAELDRTGRLEPFLDELQHVRELAAKSAPHFSRGGAWVHRSLARL